jgi:Saccharopine dehydrogenase NADP binding domain
LAGDGWQVLVAGRSGAKARAFAAKLPRAVGLAADRNGDLACLLAEQRPLLVIDAAGPFQGSGYGMVEACLAARVHYLDLADGRDFVCGVGAFDAAAKAAGVAVISGASSVPALSGAVVRELTRGMAGPERIELAISASDRAVAGTSVATAILGYAGKPVSLWRGGGWRAATGWHELRRVRYKVPGARPLSRLVALVDVPDHAILPQTVPGQPETTFRAGPEFAFQVLALWLLSWPVKWGWIGSLAPLACWLRPLQRLTAWACSERSAMMVEVSGAGQSRRWTLIAEQGDGPEVPTLAAQLLARRIAAGTIATGARAAGQDLELAEFEPLFASLAIRTALTPAASPSRACPLLRRAGSRPGAP